MRGGRGSPGRRFATAVKHAGFGPTAATLSKEGSVQQAPQPLVSHAQCCKLLQNCVRLVSALPLSPEAAAAAGATAAEATIAAMMAQAGRAVAGAPTTLPSDGLEALTGRILQSVAALLGDVQYWCYNNVDATVGPLVAPLTASTADLSSPDALQLFGLLCSLLKVYYSSASSGALLHMHAAGTPNPLQLDASTAVLAAVSSVLKATVRSGPPRNVSDIPGWYLENTSSSSTSTTSCWARAAAAAVEEVLWAAAHVQQRCRGWCCWVAAAVPVLRWCITGRASFLLAAICRFAAAAVVAASERDLTKRLQQLQGTLADVVQWLAAADTVQQLTALGYQPEDLQQQLAAAAEALPSLIEGLQAADPLLLTGPVQQWQY